MKNVSLEQRLSGFNGSVASELNRVSYGIQKIKGYPAKKDMAVELEQYFSEVFHGAESPAFISINEEPLKVVYTGMKSYGDNPEVKSLMQNLNPYEAIYLLAGMNWEGFAKSMRKDEKEVFSVFGLVCLYMQKGIEGMAIAHNKMKSKVPVGRGRQYKTTPRLPNSSRIYKETKFPEIVNRFKEIFVGEIRNPDLSEELQSPNIGERIAIMLDSLTEAERRLISKYFRQEILGDYCTM